MPVEKVVEPSNSSQKAKMHFMAPSVRPIWRWFMHLFADPKRSNVYRAAVPYGGGVWSLIQLGRTLSTPPLHRVPARHPVQWWKAVRPRFRATPLLPSPQTLLVLRLDRSGSSKAAGR